MILTLNKSLPITHLLSRNVPSRVVHTFRPIDSVKSCSQFSYVKYTDEGVAEKAPISTKRQVEWLTEMYEEPYHSEYVAYISDYKRGLLARLAAAAIFSQACANHQHGSRRSRPQWVRLTQSFVNPLTLTGDDRPGFLVIDNVYKDSTAAKVENLRDILNYYEDTPILVIVSSPGYPLELADQFSLPADYGVLLRDTRTTIKADEV